jgi:hypothetical protein
MLSLLRKDVRVKANSGAQLGLEMQSSESVLLPEYMVIAKATLKVIWPSFAALPCLCSFSWSPPEV